MTEGREDREERVEVKGAIATAVDTERALSDRCFIARKMRSISIETR